MALRKAKLHKTLSISGKNNNKVFRIENNEVFTEDQIENFDELLKGEFIILVEESNPALDKSELEEKPVISPKSKPKK